MEYLDIHSRSKNRLAQQLSNLTNRSFYFDGVLCSSIESCLQAFKIPDPRMQKEICGKTAKNARLQKTVLDKMWQKTQRLHWQNIQYGRSSSQYVALVTRLFDAAFQDPATGLKKELQESLPFLLSHSIGEANQRKTVLTEVEYLYQLYRLRATL